MLAHRMGSIKDAIDAATFPGALRGYDRDSVDAFLAHLASLDEAPWYAETPTGVTIAAPTAASLAPVDTVPPVVPNVVSMLSVAQRTIDETLVEANANAAAIVAKAADDLEAAHEQAARLVSDARYEARKEGEHTREIAAAALVELTNSRDAMSADLNELTAHVAEQRARLRDELDRLAAILDEPTTLVVAARPTPVEPPALPAVASPKKKATP